MVRLSVLRVFRQARADDAGKTGRSGSARSARSIPEKIPDHISLWGSLILFRRNFDQYVNQRPVRLMPGVTSPLAKRSPGDIDFYVVRENAESEYSSIGGRRGPIRDLPRAADIGRRSICRTFAPLQLTDRA